MIAHLYNSNAASHGGKTEAIYNCKQQSGGRWVEDLERGIMAGIAPDPWQTDTSIGDWFYNRHWKFRPVSWVIHMLVDNVSKNGNLLLNVVQRPDGAIDPEVEHMLEQLASWIAIHGEAIYGTRPWTVYGESKVRVKGGSFSEDFKYDSNEIRFTTKGPVLYAVALGWPGDRRLTIRSLAKPAGQNVNLIKDVRLLGYEGELSWKQDGEALVVTLPEQPVSEWTAALKITGSHLTNIAFDLSVPVTPDATGKLSLKPGDAECSGALHVETRGGEDNLGFWDQGKDSAAWKVNFTKPGRFRVTTAAATQHASELVVEVAGQQLGAKTPASGSWDKFQQVDLGQLTIEAAGIQVVKVRAKDPAHWNPVNLRALTLTPIP